MTRRIRHLTLAAAAASVLVAPPIHAQQLFRGDSALTVTIATDLGPLLRTRDSLELVKHSGVFSYTGDDGAPVNVPVKLRARGHFRRQAHNCDFPPLWLDVKSSDAKRTVLSGLNKLKITTNCRPKNAEFEQYILQEYILYRVYNVLTDASFRTRLLRITYRDTAGKTAPITTWGFFIEDVNDLAIHLQRTVVTRQGARFRDFDSEPLTLLSMFEYFIGNTDWSIAGLHNIAILQDSAAHPVPVPYDFDWTGAVDARYAVPDKNLPIHSITERLYRGNCTTPEQLNAALDTFRAKHALIDAIFAQVPQIAPDRARRMKIFFDNFWKRLDDPRRLQKEIEGVCQKVGN